MMTPPFDTLRLSRSLRDQAHFTSEQSEGIASALAESFQDTLVTRADVKAVEAGLKADLKAMEVGLKSDLKSEIGNLRSELYKAMGLQTLAIIGMIAALKLL